MKVPKVDEMIISKMRAIISFYDEANKNILKYLADQKIPEGKIKAVENMMPEPLEDKEEIK